MAEVEYSIDIAPLLAPWAEATRIDEFQKQHDSLLQRSAEKTEETIAMATDFLISLAKAGAVIQNSEYRSQLRGLIRYWSNFVGSETRSFPVIALQPFNAAQPQSTKSNHIENALRTAGAVLAASSSETEKLRNQFKKLEAETTRTSHALETANKIVDVMQSSVGKENKEKLVEIVLPYLLRPESQKELDQTILDLQKHELQFQLKEVNRKSREARRKTLIQFVLMAIASLILVMGVNVVLSTTKSWIGWILVIVAGLLEITAFSVAFLSEVERPGQRQEASDLQRTAATKMLENAIEALKSQFHSTPDLQRLDFLTALERAHTLGLNVDVVGEDPSNDVEPGVVLHQSPVPGALFSDTILDANGNKKIPEIQVVLSCSPKHLSDFDPIGPITVPRAEDSSDLDPIGPITVTVPRTDNISDKTLIASYEAVRTGRITDPVVIRELAQRFLSIERNPEINNSVTYDPARAASTLFQRARLYEDQARNLDDENPHPVEPKRANLNDDF